MHKRPIILDCDPGVDDAYAIMLAHSNEGFDIRAITPVAGNVEFKHTSRNALDLADMLGIDTRVAKGADRPLIIELQTAGEIHGGNGMAGYTLPMAKREFDEMKAWDVIYEEARKFKGELEIVAVGPLTNVAIAILKYGDLKDYVKRIVIMGGSATVGNHSQYGEFNIWVDPHAAEIVFHSGIPVTMFGLNATRQSALTSEEMYAMSDMETSVQDLLKGINHYVFGLRGGKDWGGTITLHDAITVGYLIDESLAETRKAYVTCEMTGRNTYGQTVTDFKGLCGKEPNVDVAMVTHVEVFRNMLKGMLEFYKAN
ncbi:nucleoside hydrolase [Youngiibacter fragilis]|nr:nucleoside hydrolase [Youngiibacter fragilis]